jgi:hypothetical protein
MTTSARIYYTTDSIKEVEDASLPAPAYILDYIAKQHIHGIPPPELTIKTNGMYHLLRNLSIKKGLVKNVRVVIANCLITVSILQESGSPPFSSEDDILIPRITFLTQLPILGYTLQRKQFPLAPAYATTFNSRQGLTLDLLGIDLTIPVCHGQLYTALTRVHRSEQHMHPITTWRKVIL